MAAKTVVLGMLLLCLGAAALEAGPEQCSTAMLRGSFGVLEQGIVLQPGLLLPFANIARITPDGAGGFTGTYTLSLGGMTISGTVTDGTYVVNPDCSYSDQFVPSPLTEVHYHVGVVTGDGMLRRLQYIYTGGALVVSGTARKLPVGGCSMQTLKGAYLVSGQGTDVSSPIPGFPVPPPFPLSHVGKLTADGAGHLSGYGFENAAGVGSQATFTATYTVTPDCFVSLEILDTAEGITLAIPETGIITGEGEFQELRAIITAPGVVFADTYSRR